MIAEQTLVSVVLLATDETPDENDVVAGWAGLAVFIGLVLAVAVLLWSFTRQLRKAQRAKDQGVYGPVEDDGTDGGSDATDGSPRPREGEA